MPNLRSQKRSSEETVVKEEEEQTNVKMEINKADNISQWIMLGPESLFNDGSISIARLPHPQNGVASLFGFKDKSVFELMKYKEIFRSWFINETVQKDGSFTIMTPMDPLFLALPFVEKSSIKGHFTTLDNILMDDEYSPGMRQLESCLSHNQLLKICDSKGSDDLIVYKGNREKITQWLTKKVYKMQKHLENASINVKQGAQITGFVRSSDGHNKKDDCLRYSWEMVSDYITEAKSLELKEKFEIKDLVKPVAKTDPPLAKRQKLNDETESCVEDYRDKNTDKNKKSAGNQTKLTRTQKQLSKVDKKGMKTMSSFFTAKPKK